MKTTLLIAGLSALALAAPVHATDVHTRTIASTCFACHGNNGVSNGAIPSIAGLDKAYFVKTMQDFKSGARPASIMKRHASGYTDAEFVAMGDYFASLKK